MSASRTVPSFRLAGNRPRHGDSTVGDGLEPVEDRRQVLRGMDVVDRQLEQLVSGVAEQRAGGRIHPAEAPRRHLGDEDGFGCALEDRRVAELGRDERVLRAPLLGDVRDRAQHPHRSPGPVELQRAAPVDPAFLAGVRADDPVLPVERPAATDHLVGEVGDHRLAVSRMDERGPALHRPVERGIDPEDRVEALRAHPASRRDVGRVRTDPRDRLHLVEQTVSGRSAAVRRPRGGRGRRRCPEASLALVGGSGLDLCHRSLRFRSSRPDDHAQDRAVHLGTGASLGTT